MVRPSKAVMIFIMVYFEAVQLKWIDDWILHRIHSIFTYCLSCAPSILPIWLVFTSLEVYLLLCRPREDITAIMGNMTSLLVISLTLDLFVTPIWNPDVFFYILALKYTFLPMYFMYRSMEAERNGPRLWKGVEYGRAIRPDSSAAA